MTRISAPVFGKYEYVIFSDVPERGEDPGPFKSNVWVTRNLNTEEFAIPENGSKWWNLNQNTIELNKGSYLISASAPAFAVDLHKLRLAKVESLTIDVGETKLAGASSFARNEHGMENRAILKGIIEVGNNSELFKLQHICQKYHKDGLGLRLSGVVSNMEDKDIFSIVEIIRFAK